MDSVNAVNNVRSMCIGHAKVELWRQREAQWTNVLVLVRCGDGGDARTGASVHRRCLQLNTHSCSGSQEEKYQYFISEETQ